MLRNMTFLKKWDESFKHFILIKVEYYKWAKVNFLRHLYVGTVKYQLLLSH